jgi:hypothetical protein
MVAELDRAARIGLDQLPESCAPLHEGRPPQILAVEVQEIEGKEHDAMRRLMYGPAQRIEIREAILILDDNLAIDQSRLAGELGSVGDWDRREESPEPPRAQHQQGIMSTPYCLMSNR